MTISEHLRSHIKRLWYAIGNKLLFNSYPDNEALLLEFSSYIYKRRKLYSEVFNIVEGAINTNALCVSDIMMPRANVKCISVNDDFESIIHMINECKHSRYPLINKNQDDVIGIVLTKDLINYWGMHDLNVRDHARPAIFIPESKPLLSLLHSFRANKNHMAIVVDEYSNMSGIVTIEDVLEQIIGCIEDEHDFDQVEDSILQDSKGIWRAKGSISLEDFNSITGSSLESKHLDTLGGFIIEHISKIPSNGSIISLKGFNFKILSSDSRRIILIHVTRLEK